MHGMMLWDKGQDLVLTEITPTLPPVGDVYVKIHSAAVNKRDYWITRGQYPGIVYPLILGSDGAGVLDDKEVIINPGINWGDNPRHFCPGFKILGMPDNGTFAQMVKVPLENLYPRPQHLSWAESAALPVAGVTAYRALFTRGKAMAGENVLITGIGGGVATTALLFAVAHGMNVWVTSSSEEKINRAKELGAKGGVNYKLDSWDKQLNDMNQDKFDMVIDGAGSSGFSRLMTMMNSNGRLVIYGGTAGAINDLSPQRIFWKEIDILGSTMGSPQDFQAMVDFVNLHKIKPVISHTFSLDEINEAIGVVGRNEQFGKVCIEIT